MMSLMTMKMERETRHEWIRSLTPICIVMNGPVAGLCDKLKQGPHLEMVELTKSESFQDGPNMVSESTALSRNQAVSWLSPSCREKTQRLPLSLVLVGQSELTKFFAELSEFVAELSEFSLSKEYSRNSLPPI